MDPGGITAVTILAEKKPKTVGEERQLIGFLSYYRRYIPNFACLAKPLYIMLNKPKSASGSKHTTRKAPKKRGMASYHLQHQLCGQKTINSQ